MYLKKTKLSNFLFCVALFVSFFPHTTFGIFNLGGSQISLIFPFFFFVFLICSIKILKFNFFILLIFLISLFAYIINFYFTEKYYYSLILRTSVNYFFFIIFLICFNTYYYPNEEKIKKIIFSSNIIWLIWGLVQVLGITNENFAFTNRTIKNSTVAARGLNSLATEPFYFGMILILFNSFYLFRSKFNSINLSKVEIQLLIFNFLSIFFIIKAASTTLLATLIFFIFFLKNYNLFKKNNIFLISILFFISSASILYFFDVDKSSNRGLGYLIAFFNPEQIEQLFTHDWSFNSRVENMVSPLIGLYLNYGMPGGFNGYLDSRNEIEIIFYNLTSYSFISQINLMNINNMKISSFLGDFLFQQGIFGIFLILLITIKIFDNNSYINSLRILFIIFIITINAPMTYSLLPLLLYISMYSKNLNN